MMDRSFAPAEIDTSRPHPARIYDCLLGGKDNYAVDRQAAADILQAAPHARDIARHNRAFLQRAVRYLVAERGIGQVIDIGTGIPSAGNVHEVAHAIDPGVRVAYVDNDPIVHVHAQALLSQPGTTGIVLGDLRQPEAILAHPVITALIDFTQPVALLLVAVLHFLAGDDHPAQVVATLRDALPAGSYLALTHGTADQRPEGATAAASVYDRATSTATPRSHAEILAFFDGFDLEEPGLVQVPLWRPARRPPRDLASIWMYGGVARKPGPG